MLMEHEGAQASGKFCYLKIGPIKEVGSAMRKADTMEDHWSPRRTCQAVKGGEIRIWSFFSLPVIRSEVFEGHGPAVGHEARGPAAGLRGLHGPVRSGQGKRRERRSAR